jgi:hypothetical protein
MSRNPMAASLRNRHQRIVPDKRGELSSRDTFHALQLLDRRLEYSRDLMAFWKAGDRGETWGG